MPLAVDTHTVPLDTVELVSKAIRARARPNRTQSDILASREAIMDANGSGRRRFLKQAAALAGVAAGAGAGAEWAARGQSGSGASALKSELAPNDVHNHVDPRRGVRRNINHITYFTPLQDYGGIITPTSLHFVQLHTSYFPVIDPQQHRLTIHGMVDRPLSFTMDDLMRLPS